MILDAEEKIFQVIGRNVKYFRQMYGIKNKIKLTQQQLAKEVGVSTALIGNLESEKVRQGISVHTLWRLSEVLDVPVEKFFKAPHMETAGENYRG